MARRRIGYVKVDGRIIGWWEREPLIFGAEVFHLVSNFENYVEELASDKYGLAGVLFGSVPQDARLARRVILQKFREWLDERRSKGEGVTPYGKRSRSPRNGRGEQ